MKTTDSIKAKQGTNNCAGGSANHGKVHQHDKLSHSLERMLTQPKTGGQPLHTVYYRTQFGHRLCFLGFHKRYNSLEERFPRNSQFLRMNKQFPTTTFVYMAQLNA
jgi:hypothetical protein